MAYPPPYYTESDIRALHRLMRAYPFALLMAEVNGRIECTHIPIVFVQPDASDGNALGRLEGHVVITNPLVSAIDAGADAVVVFGGAHAYISPAWYIESRTVPTWNYQSVDARGTLARMPDAALMPHLRQLVATFEASAKSPWTLEAGVPAGYAESLTRGIRGFCLTLTELTGVSKLNQNKSLVDRRSVVEHLRALGGDLNAEVARQMEEGLS